LRPDRWQQLKEVFEAALQVDPPRRADFLEEACRADPELKKEAVELLSLYESRDEFLEKPVYQEAASLLTSDPAAPLERKNLGPYVLLRKIGEGGMGMVYLAHDTRLDRQVAIKAVAPRFTGDKHFRVRLQREAVAAARLSHPGIATIFALEEIDGNLYLVREYVRGKSLHEELAQAPLETSRLLEIALQTARALAAAHAQAVVHRDLKPANLIWSEEAGIKILDFGLARMLNAGNLSGQSLTQRGAFVGTPAYASPEQLRGAEVDFRTDLFSFGVLLFELASGTHPFASSDWVATVARVLDVENLDFSPLRAQRPEELSRIIRRCLRKDPALRYEKTADLVADVENLRALVPKTGAASKPAASEKGKPKPNLKPLWWWQCHQATVAIVYCLMVYPLWRAREWTGSPWRDIIFFSALAAVAVASTLRFHLWFSSAFYAYELSYQQGRVSRWIRLGDVIFVAMLLAQAGAIYGAHGSLATLFVSVAIGCLVVFTLIEPTTTRAAFQSGANPE
jgi:eukaryotic-like serine/threonine-protein kinase